MNTSEITVNKDLVAACGLYCGACKSYLNGKCPGCRENTKATWCKTRQCCLDNSLQSCADCTSIHYMDCKKFNNGFSKLIGFILNSDRPACIRRIKDVGYEAFASEMAASGRQSIKRR